MGTSTTQSVSPVCDDALLCHVRGIIKFYFADAARDEQVAGSVLRDSSPGAHNSAPVPGPMLSPMSMKHACGQYNLYLWCIIPFICMPQLSNRGLKCVGRDRTHASRRILLCPYKACPYLNDTYDMFLNNYDSPISLIQNSHVFRDWFGDNIMRSKLSCGKGLRSLSFRRHRLDKEGGHCDTSWHIKLNSCIAVFGKHDDVKVDMTAKRRLLKYEIAMT